MRLCLFLVAGCGARSSWTGDVGADAGTRREGDTCGASGVDDCGEGLFCHFAGPGSGDEVRICRRFCDEDSTCGREWYWCAYGLRGDEGRFSLCAISCNPMTNEGCPEGTACQLVDPNGEDGGWFTDCDGQAGDAEQGDECSHDGGVYETDGPLCAPGFSCADGLPGTCRSWCDTPGATGSCPAGTTCTAMTPPAVIGDAEYGLCR